MPDFSPRAPYNPSFDGAAGLLDDGIGVVSLGGATRLVTLQAVAAEFRMTPAEMLETIDHMNVVLEERGLPTVPVLRTAKYTYLSHHALDLSLALLSDPYCDETNWKEVALEYKGLARYQIRERLARLSDDFFSAIRTKIRRRVYDAELVARKAELGLGRHDSLPAEHLRVRGVKPGSCTPATRRQPKPTVRPRLVRRYLAEGWDERLNPISGPAKPQCELPSEAVGPSAGEAPANPETGP